MLHIYESHRLDALFDVFSIKLIDSPNRSLLQPANVIIPNKDTGRWLHIQLAKAHGISAFIQPKLPAFFIHELNLQLDEHYEGKLPDKNEYAWRIYSELKNTKNESFKHLQEYSGDDNLKRYQLAGIIADLFDQYVLFRPEMIASWNRGVLHFSGNKHEKWQFELWRAIRKQDSEKTDRATLFHQLSKVLETGKLRLENPLFVFNPGAIPPTYARILALISLHVPVFWFKNDTVVSNHPTTHPLVSVLGEDQLNNSLMLDTILKNIPHKIERITSIIDESTSLLGSVQTCIRERTALKVDKSDNSIQIHACHNALREIQVLHDSILDFLEHQKDAGPGDVLVLSTDLSAYSGFIDAVFNAPQENTPKLPVFINDSGNTITSRTISLFLEILNIHRSNFKITSILDLIEQKAIREKFEMNDQEVALAEHWLKETGARWGIDAEHRGDSGIHSWEFAIDRLISGFMMPHYNEKESFDIAPYTQVEGATGLKLTGFLYQLKDWFKSWHRFISKPHKPNEWVEKLREIVSFWIPDSEEYQRAISSILKSVQDIQESESYLGKDESFQIDLITEFLEGNLSTSSAGSSYRMGAVTFSSMVPVRHLPFRFIAVLGLNEHQFPGNDARNSFDLMEKDFKPGDRSIRITNKGLFLDALLTAGDVFYMSYTGFKMMDGSNLPASLVVNELLEYLNKQGCALKVVKHRLHGFHPDYFIGNQMLFTYQEKNEQLARFYNEISEPKSALERLDVPLPTPEGELILTLEELHKFLRKPYTWLTENKLGMRKIRDEVLPEDRDVFSLDPLDSWKLNQLFMSQIKKDRQIDSLFTLFKQRGLLPYGIAAEPNFDDSFRKFCTFWDAIPPEIKELVTDKKQRIEEVFHFDEQSVVFRAGIPEITQNSIAIIEASGCKPHRKLHVWLQHLSANLSMLVDTFAVFFDSKKVEPQILHFMPVEHARELLAKIIEVMVTSQNQPLPAYPKMFEDYESKLGDMEKVLKDWNSFFNVDAFENTPTVYKEDSNIENFIDYFDETWTDEILRFYDIIWNPMTKSLSIGGKVK